MAKGDAEYETLRDALTRFEPPCDGDDRYTSERLTTGDMRAMNRICETCPIHVRTACNAYAVITKPPGTYWAGHYYPAPTERKPRG